MKKKFIYISFYTADKKLCECNLKKFLVRNLKTGRT